MADIHNGEHGRDPQQDDWDLADRIDASRREMVAGTVARLEAENNLLRAVVREAARELYVVEVHRQSVGMDNYAVKKMRVVQHKLAAASGHIDGSATDGN